MSPADLHPPVRRGTGPRSQGETGRRNGPSAGPQGEALILELSSAKKILDRNRHGSSRDQDAVPEIPRQRDRAPDITRGHSALDMQRDRDRAPPPIPRIRSGAPDMPRPRERGPEISGERDGMPNMARERMEQRRPPGKTDRMLRPLPRNMPGLDRFDQRSLRDPVAIGKIEPIAKRFDDRLLPKRRTDEEERDESPVVSAVRSGVETLRTQWEWLVTGKRPSAESARDFASHVARVHEFELKVASRVLIISATIAGGWATLVPLSSAVVVPGKLVVESSVKKIQHPTGGVVADIPVHDGMHVSAGTLLVRLDETQVQAGEKVVADQLDQARIRTARLIAERDGQSDIQVPKELANRMKDPAVAQLVASETSLFKARANTRDGQKNLYQANIQQFEQQVGGYQAEIQSKSSQLDLIAKELSGVQELFAKGLVPLTRMTALQRDSAQLEGDRAQLTATIAETKAKIGQAQLQISQIDQQFRSEVMKDLGEAQNQVAELTQKNVSAKDQLDRVEIRAPTPGVVHQLAVHTIGGVVKAGDTIMEIVPDSDDLEIEGHLPPNDIDQVHIGQQAYLRFSTIDRQTMPQAKATVSYVSADLTQDERTTTPFYTVRVDLPAGERHNLNGLTLVSGMPVEIFLQTGSRTMLTYLFKPITDQLHRMFTEP
jgi:HlyD family secretion protein